MRLTEACWNRLRNGAARAGFIAGCNRGAWVTDGNTADDTYRVLLDGIRNGDPEVLDGLYSAPLSGEWADGLTPAEALSFIDDGITPLLTEDDRDSLLTIWEDGYGSGVLYEVEHSCRYQLDDGYSEQAWVSDAERRENNARTMANVWYPVA